MAKVRKADKSDTAIEIDEDAEPTVEPVPEVVVEKTIPSVKANEPDFVRVIMSKTLEPCPKIGNVNLGHLLSKSKMVEKEVYNIPLNAARVLIDAGAAFALV